MATLTFDTSTGVAQTLLKNCEDGKLHPRTSSAAGLEEERIMSLTSAAIPSAGADVAQAERSTRALFLPIALLRAHLWLRRRNLEQLLLDGQQRMTSLYQSCMRCQVVSTITAKKRLVKRWFYIDMTKVPNSEADRDSAIYSSEDRKPGRIRHDIVPGPVIAGDGIRQHRLR